MWLSWLSLMATTLNITHVSIGVENFGYLGISYSENQTYAALGGYLFLDIFCIYGSNFSTQKKIKILHQMNFSQREF
jgi:hypothetical protein